MENLDENLVVSTKIEGDEIENILRPRSMDGYIGQNKVKDNLCVFMQSAKILLNLLLFYLLSFNYIIRFFTLAKDSVNASKTPYTYSCLYFYFVNVCFCFFIKVSCCKFLNRSIFNALSNYSFF